MELATFLHKLRTTPTTLNFSHTLDTIHSNYHYTPTAFRNGELMNAAGQNEGSCKIFSFAKMQSLNEQQTLHCFGEFYREDVLKNPDGDDHSNIRNFMRHGWAAISFNASALTDKKI